MLTPETPFPYPGSYALVTHEGRDKLARIIARRWAAEAADVPAHEEVVIGFPLRGGAGGNIRIEAAALIDATPLTTAEEREYHDLDRSLIGRSLRTPRQKATVTRRDALRRRMVYAPILAHLLRELRQSQRKAA